MALVTLVPCVVFAADGSTGRPLYFAHRMAVLTVPCEIGSGIGVATRHEVIVVGISDDLIERSRPA
jgi:hypothetical protein